VAGAPPDCIDGGAGGAGAAANAALLANAQTTTALSAIALHAFLLFGTPPSISS
jgi:hypothetical protein